jgi:LuxR family maltose regulon positive regulatory protein
LADHADVWMLGWQVLTDTAPVLARPLARGTTSPAAGTVPVARLVRRLTAASATPLAVIVAPAGYGKTTLLTAWAARDPRAFEFHSLAGGDVPDGVDAILQTLEFAGPAHVIVVDDLQLASEDDAQRLLDAAARLPKGTTLAVASRTRPAWPIGGLRAQRLVTEVRASDLRLSRLEAAMLLDAEGLRLGGAHLDELLERTEGWPAMLLLAARMPADEREMAVAPASFTGASGVIAEYLADEVLGALTPAERTFLRRASVLPRLDGAACDMVLTTRGSGELLASLARRGVPLEPLDDGGLAFRAHPLLREALAAELTRAEPERVASLHRRAARWHRHTGDYDAAIRHALAARDTKLAAWTLWTQAPWCAATGEGALLAGRLALFGTSWHAAPPALELSAALHHLLSGRRHAAAGAVDAAERGLSGQRDLRAACALIRACLARDGVSSMTRDAALARSLLGPASPWQGLAFMLLGVAAQLGGEGDAAAALLEEAVGRATDHLPVVAALASTQRALLCADAEDWEEAARCVREADRETPRSAPDAVRALALAASAVVATTRGEIAQARIDAADADRLLAAQLDFPPWMLAEAHAWLARADIALSDGRAARTQLARAARLAARVPGEVSLSRWIHAGWGRADAFAESATGDGPALTNAELRILRLLPSHMSFREMGERLHVSTNTVKTQALAVYRKLDVCCRSDAVARGRSVGLIGEP